MFEKLAKVVGPKVGLVGLAVKDHQPEIFLTAGVVTGIASAVMLAKAHKQSEETFHNVLGEIEATRNYVDDNNSVISESGDVPDGWEEFTDADARRMLLPLYIETARRVAVLYGPSVLMGIASLGLILASHKSLKTRNRALVSTIALIERGFAQYRKRVVGEMGTEADERFYYGAEARGVTTVTVDEDGKKKKKKETKNHIPEEYDPSMYERVFDETNNNWSNNEEMTEFFLRMTEDHLNGQLTIKGWMTLNTVYKSLGFEDSPEGAVVGWSKKVPGDDYISFGIDNDINRREGDYRYILDFNVNGVILNHIGER